MVENIFLFIAFVHCHFYYSYAAVRMLTHPQIRQLDAGESCALACHFIAHHSDFNLFDNPVIWIKYQLTEQVHMNINGNLQLPFLHEKRFSIGYIQETQQNMKMHKVDLNITDVRGEDNGNYTCEVRGPDSVVLAKVTHYVFIREPVQELFITTANETRLPIQNSEPSLRFTEGKQNILRCISIGGYPPPQLQVLIKCNAYQPSYDVNNDLSRSQTSKLTGSRGLQTITYYTQLWSFDFNPKPEYDGCQLTCAANLPGLQNDRRYVTDRSAVLHVRYTPRIRCYNQSASLGDRNVHLTCDALANPRVTNYWWMIDAEGTTLYEHDSYSGYWTLVTPVDEGHVHRFSLYMRVAEERSFRTYTMYAQNDIGTASESVILFQKIVPTLSTPLVGIGRAPDISYSARIDSGSESVRPHHFKILYLLLYFCFALKSQ